ncbi:hypothetical protein HMPREF9012_0339 [Bacteroidetes bacterium oral taxon 272 str. F0290]|nr:hypothetical protein HMPREF9012_0339 [Bacteroidetes bacterium oral taxon 272 str. F0290]
MQQIIRNVAADAEVSVPLQHAVDPLQVHDVASAGVACSAQCDVSVFSGGQPRAICSFIGWRTFRGWERAENKS